MKPANIIWDPQNSFINIVDFNRAKFISPEEQCVFSESSSDKDYMAPECFTKNQGFQFSRKSDVYSLGKILKEHFTDKKYLGYDELMTKRFLDKMTSLDATKRPKIEECKEFFRQLENKMKLDMEQPNNKVRLGLSKKIIDLEIAANQQREKGATEDYEKSVDAIETITQALSTPEIDTSLLKEKSSKVGGFFNYKKKYQETIGENLEQEEEKNNKGRILSK